MSKRPTDEVDCEGTGVADRAEWLRAARDFGNAITDELPFTVLLGAGSSLSSGAPSYPAVKETLRSRVASRLDPEHLADEMHTVDARDKSIGLRPDFRHVVPSIGYRCLAALARTRRVTVLNLNWESAAADAARRLDVPVVEYDLFDTDDWPAEPPDRGLVVVHLHGTLDNPRVGRGEKPTIDAAPVQHLAALHAGGRLIVLGASLDEDQDIRDLLPRIGADRTGNWAFFRDSTPEDALRHRNAIPGVMPAVSVHPDVDFDRLLMLVADTAFGLLWDTHRLTHEHVDLPTLDDIVLPRPGVLLPLLDAHVGVLVGDSHLGKTTLAHLLAYLRVLCAGAGTIHAVDGADASLAAVAVPDGAPQHDVLIVENPFGEGLRLTPNPAFHDKVAAWAADPTAPTLLVTSRTGDWHDPQSWAAGIVRPHSPAPGEWYELDALKRLARTVHGRVDPSHVHAGFLDTPGRIRDAASGITVVADTPGAPGAQREEALERGRRDVLDRDPSLGLLCALTRLQECGGGSIEQATLERLAGCRAGKDTHALAMLRSYTWEERRWLRLASTPDRLAADAWIASHWQELHDLAQRPSSPPGLLVGCIGWQAASDAQQGRASSTPTETAEHAGLILDADRSPPVIERVAAAEFTSWTLAEAAPTVVRIWSALPDDGPRQRLLASLLDNDAACGVYGMLEACLYVGGAAPPEIRTDVTARLWKLLERDPWQCTLALDGLAWRLPADARHDYVAWARDAADVVPPGALAVIAAYHPQGVFALDSTGGFARRAALTWAETDADDAQRLVIWHFVHQCRARAQMARQHWVDKPYLCRTLHPTEEASNTDALDRLVSGLVHHGRTGWALLAASFVMGALGRDVGDGARRLLAEAIPTAPPADPGIVAAVATYPAAVHRSFAGPVNEYFADRDNRDALIEAQGGLVLPDQPPLRAPEASFAMPPAEVHQLAGVRFHRLASLGHDSVDPRFVVAKIEPALEAAAADGVVSEAQQEALIELVQAGDLRPLDDAVAAFGSIPDVGLGELAVHAASVVDLP